MLGGARSTEALGLSPAPATRHEYGSTQLTLELVDSMDEAIDHIHEHGSSHTECIVTGAVAPLSCLLAGCCCHQETGRQWNRAQHVLACWNSKAWHAFSNGVPGPWVRLFPGVAHACDG